MITSHQTQTQTQTQFCECTGSGLSVHSLPPKPSAVKVPDLFEVLGPSSVFCAANSWTPPRTVSLITHPHTTLGLCIGKSRPVIITSVDPGGSAQVCV